MASSRSLSRDTHGRVMVALHTGVTSRQTAHNCQAHAYTLRQNGKQPSYCQQYRHATKIIARELNQRACRTLLRLVSEIGSSEHFLTSCERSYERSCEAARLSITRLKGFVNQVFFAFRNALRREWMKITSCCCRMGDIVTPFGSCTFRLITCKNKHDRAYTPHRKFEPESWR